MTSLEVLQQRRRRAARRGAAFLDERVPGWADRIDLDAFDLSSCSSCTLGQLFRDAKQIPMWASRGYSSLEDAVTNGWPMFVTDVTDEDLVPLTPEGVKSLAEIAAEEHFAETVVASNYTLGCWTLGLTAVEAHRLGFSVNLEAEEIDANWDALGHFWVLEIRKRQVSR